MKTERLYYQDAYLREFDARVVARRATNDRPAIALDRTAFYATGGGQPCDTGLLAAPAGDSARVLDVEADGELQWHLLDRNLPGEVLHGAIDWGRRFDHMQQHTGQHVLSQAFAKSFDAETVAFHLGDRSCSIDLNRTDLDGSMVARAENLANSVVDAALRVTSDFVTPDEVSRLPLRKPPAVRENVRVVQVSGFDWSACGGTHVANSSQIGLIKIVGTERRGPELRVSFLCGVRARSDYSRLKTLAQGLVLRFTAAEDDILDLVDRRATEAEALRREVAELEKEWVDSKAQSLWDLAEQPARNRVVAVALDITVERAKKIAQVLRARAGTLVCIGVRGERPQILMTRSDDINVDAGALLRVAAAAGGGRGGGRPDWAQGGVPTNEALDAALDAAKRAFRGLNNA